MAGVEFPGLTDGEAVPDRVPRLWRLAYGGTEPSRVIARMLRHALRAAELQKVLYDRYLMQRNEF